MRSRGLKLLKLAEDALQQVRARGGEEENLVEEADQIQLLLRLSCFDVMWKEEKSKTHWLASSLQGLAETGRLP